MDSFFFLFVSIFLAHFFLSATTTELPSATEIAPNNEHLLEKEKLVNTAVEDYLFLLARFEKQTSTTIPVTPDRIATLLQSAPNSDDVRVALRDLRRHVEEQTEFKSTEELRGIKIPDFEETCLGATGKSFPTNCDVLLCSISILSFFQCGIFNWFMPTELWRTPWAICNVGLNTLYGTGELCAGVPAVRAASKCLSCTGAGQFCVDHLYLKQIGLLTEKIIFEAGVTEKNALFPHNLDTTLPSLHFLATTFFVEPNLPKPTHDTIQNEDE